MLITGTLLHRFVVARIHDDIDIDDDIAAANNNRNASIHHGTTATTTTTAAIDVFSHI